VCQVQRHSVTADTPDFAVRYDVLRERREHLHPRLRSCSCEARSAGWVGGVVRSLGVGLSLSTSPRCVLRCYSRGAKKNARSPYICLCLHPSYMMLLHTPVSCGAGRALVAIMSTNIRSGPIASCC
jgi:hypothetical protein